jgi:hypothetical protein
MFDQAPASGWFPNSMAQTPVTVSVDSKYMYAVVKTRVDFQYWGMVIHPLVGICIYIYIYTVYTYMYIHWIGMNPK